MTWNQERGSFKQNVFIAFHQKSGLRDEIIIRDGRYTLNIMCSLSAAGIEFA
jgi:hypothetical protein